MDNRDEFFNKVRERIVGKKIKGIDSIHVGGAYSGLSHPMRGDVLVLEDGITLTLYMSEANCCASARGKWALHWGPEAGITDIEFDVHTEYAEDEWDVGSHFSMATITVLHGSEILATADCQADDGNAGYYFSTLNLKVLVPNNREELDEAILSC